MESWFCIWDDLLRLFAIARVANPKTGLNLAPKPLFTITLAATLQPFTQKNNRRGNYDM
jgi:hypothetical protein